MTTRLLQDFIRHLYRARSVAEDGHLTDAQLLERFATARDEAAFEVLVWRHGPLVLNVARRLVRRSSDAEDVFQATFLTLARKAASIRRGTSVGSWLYKVAYRIALRVRQAAIRRESREQSGVEKVALVAPAEGGDAESAAIVADEVSRLPERYRSAVVLCYLQGSTTEEAARILGCPRGTILSRLAWARHRLNNRLIRRGVAPAIALAAASFGENATAMPSVALVASVVRAALPFRAYQGTIPAISPQVAALARGALQMMMWNKIKMAMAVMCVLGLTGVGAGWLTHGRVGAEAFPLAAEPPANKDLPNAVVPERKDNTKNEIRKIHAEMDKLADMEHVMEAKLSEEMILARLHLVELQDELRIREGEGDFEDGKFQARRKEAELRILLVQEELKKIDVQTESGKQHAERKVKLLKDRQEELRNEHDALMKLKLEHIRALRPIRKEVYQAEETLRRLETRQARQREDFAEKRQALRSRLQQLEEITLRLEPADRLRDVQRKLDALRRDLSELRQAVERQTGEARKKP